MTPVPAARSLVGAGSVVAVVSTVVGVVRVLAMPAMPAMPGAAGPGLLLHGMPLADMPEMWVAGAGLLAVVAGALWTGTPAPSPPPSRARRRAVVVIATLGLTVDVSKTSTLGFVIPGMRTEYGITAGTASLLAVAGLSGTAAGAVLLGRLCDRIGRRATYLVATLAFAATSMCGSMPTFGGNLVMCGLMGLAVGGLAPLLVTLLADELGVRHRATVVALSVAATASGYLLAAGSAWLLEPVFGWRVLWLIGAPTGLALLALTPWIPTRPAPREEDPVPDDREVDVLSRNTQRAYAFLVGVMTFGLTTWVPTLARAGGLPVGSANLLLTVAALVMVPCALVAMAAYRRHGPSAVMVVLAAASAVVLAAVTLGTSVASPGWLSAGALVAALFAVNTMTAVFLPVTANLAPAGHRGRATGGISLANRVGGLCGPLLIAGLVTSTTDVLVAVSLLAAGATAAATVLAVRRSRARPTAPEPPGDARVPVESGPPMR